MISVQHIVFGFGYVWIAQDVEILYFLLNRVNLDKRIYGPFSDKRGLNDIEVMTSKKRFKRRHYFTVYIHCDCHSIRFEA